MTAEEELTTLDESLVNDWLFRPLFSQNLFQGTTTRFKGFSGPVGSGKSAALCFEAVRQAFINFGLQGLVAAPTYGMLRDATLVALMRLLDEVDLDFDFHKSNAEVTFRELGGSSILMRSLDEPERLRGTNLAWFGVDEMSYTREEAWVRLEARLREPRARRLTGFGVWTPQGHDWLYRRFINKPVSGYGCVQARPFENSYLLDKTPDYYSRLESSYDPKFYQQEVLGAYVNSRADRVYYCFNPGVHSTKQQYDSSRPLLWALDFNVSPMTSVIVQRFGERYAVIDEIVLERATTEEACMEFENRYGRHLAGVEVFGDASGKNMHTTGLTDYVTLQNHLHRSGIRAVKVRVPAANPPVLSRVQRVNALFTNAQGEVQLEISSKCKELIQDLEEVLFKPDSGVIDKARDPKRTHASDALGYMVWELFGTKTTVGEINRPLF